MVGNAYWFSPVLGIESAMQFMPMSSKSCFEEVREGALILRDLLGSSKGVESDFKQDLMQHSVGLH